MWDKVANLTPLLCKWGFHRWFVVDLHDGVYVRWTVKRCRRCAASICVTTDVRTEAR